MKKIAVLAVVVLACVLGWVGATSVVGGKVEKYYFGLLEQYGQWGPLTLTNQRYDRGFLRSHAETVLEVTIPGSGSDQDQEPTEETLQLVFEHTMHHGPFPFGPDLEGQSSLSPALALVETRLIGISPDDEELEELLAEIPELKDSIALLKVGFSGRTNGRLQVPPFEKEREDTRISCGGLTVTTDYNPGDKTLLGMIDLPKMQIRVADRSMAWNGVRGEYDMVEALPLLYVGASKVVFGAMDMTVPGESAGETQVIQVQEFEVTGDSGIEGKLVHFNQSMTFNGLTFDDQTYGPLLIDMEAKNLDAMALSEMQQQMQVIYQGANNFDPDELAAKVIPLYSDLLMKLLAGSPELNVSRLHVATPMGLADGTFRMKFSGQGGVPVDNPFALLQQLQYLESAIDVAVDESLIRGIVGESLRNDLQADRKGETSTEISDEEIELLVDQQLGSQLDMLLSQNFIIRDGEKIKSSATFNRGELVVNGQLLPFSL